MPAGKTTKPLSKSGIRIADQWLRQILILLYQRRTLSRIEMIEATGLNAASVSHALGYLQSRGILLKAGDCDVGTGRLRELFTLNAEAGYFVAVDLEGDRLRFGLTNCRETCAADGKRLWSFANPCDRIASSRASAGSHAIWTSLNGGGFWRSASATPACWIRKAGSAP